MINRILLVCVIVCISPLLVFCWGWGGSSDGEKVLLKNVDVITLHVGRMTTGRRSSPVPQLMYKGSSSASKYAPNSVQCVNRGSDGHDAQWECTADLSNDVRFGDINVICEGYDYPNDPYILKGSCGLEYSLEFTGQRHHDSSYNKNYNQYKTSSGSQGGIKWTNLLIIGFVVFIIYNVYKSCIMVPVRENDTDNVPYPRQQARGNRLYPDLNPPPYPGRGPSAPPADDPPPAYGWASNATRRTGGNNTSSQGSSSTRANTGSSTYTTFEDRQAGPSTHTHAQANQQQQQGGGFWTGAGIGGIVGYLFGNRGRGGGYGYQQPYYGGGWGSGWGGRTRHNRGWGSGWGGGTGYGGNRGWGSGGGGNSWFGGSTHSSSSSGSRRATGFGSTSRR